ncbi:V-set domain-containing T-cell activation inhibitor 1-like isoform X6 [Siniperca chuatsi]|uniref:V-set domain-containing T-cell activation inhibitor 1-like isoform X4 n=1 Tax=Siniperca chuatsi TaxID=119488 RepID=UPI001CE20279|nr:V-set domain-containing T-cell activation inhibitor 1-like isoform X4 [Siniperca chuatsi]XP_044039850.1 V-set domain-containing T-cell activation inhibitor 1-like isoform X4 [Siniperca chuatsi]XP_044039859.1 V-set domain-containing T-cell activation inhibitor 1-like isoform X6 [Siniperca chuatsi]
MSGLKVTARELLSCFCLMSWSGKTLILGHEHGPGVVKVVVKEGSDVILPCSLSTKENIESKIFDWKKDGQKEVFLYDAGYHYNNGRPGQDEQFKGRVSHFQDELKHGNASIIIRNMKLTDSGGYTCAFPLLQPESKIHIELVVGAAPEPHVTIVDVTEFGVLLQCDVRGAFPQPKLQWQDSDGNILRAEEPQVSERGDHYDITLQTAVTKTKTNCFHCVVEQEDIGHKISANITVREKLFEDTCSKVAVTGGLVGFVLGAVAVGVVLALLVAAKCITIRRNKGSPQQRNGSCNGPSALPLNAPVSERERERERVCESERLVKVSFWLQPVHTSYLNCALWILLLFILAAMFTVWSSHT